MESNQLNDVPNEEAVIELLTLTCEIDRHGTKRYRNEKGRLHRIYGPAIMRCASANKLEVMSWWQNHRCLGYIENKCYFIYDKGHVHSMDKAVDREVFLEHLLFNGFKNVEQYL